MKSYYVGMKKACGCITAAMVDDEQTTAKDVASFAKDVAKYDRNLRHIELPDDERLEIKFCRCTPVTVAEVQK